MKLYLTPTSPYARMVQIVILEKGLGDRVELVPAQTRVAESPYYAVNPSGRVPYLVIPRDDGSGASDGVEDSALICRILDRLDGTPSFEPDDPAPTSPHARYEAAARSMLDGLAVWARELRRPEHERSPGILEHERERSRRLVAYWDGVVDDPVLASGFGYPHLTLIVGLELDARLEGFAWRESHPRLHAWAERVGARPSVAATRL